MASERVVVVGAGGISPAWFRPLKAEGVQVAAVVDLRLEQAQKRIAEFELTGTEASSDMVAMVKKHKPDFVIDLTIPEAHCKTVCTALELGCHVVSEKPMASSMAEARQMVAVAEKTGRLYMVSQSRRWDARHEIVHRVITGGALGRLTTVNCDFYIGAHFGGFRDEMDSPLILDMAIHHFDLARYMSGTDPVAVYAKEFNPAGSWYKGDVAASCIFEMSNGVIFTYRGSWCAEGFHTSWNGDWRFITDKGTLLYEKDQDPKAVIVASNEGFHRQMRDVAMPPACVQYTGMHGALREMLEFLRSGKKPQCECHDNIQSLAMVFAAIESSRKGERVAVKTL